MNKVADHLLVVEPTRFSRYRRELRDVSIHGPQRNRRRSGIAKRAGVTVRETSRRKYVGSKQGKHRKQSKRNTKVPYRKVTELESDIARTKHKIEELNSQMVDPAVLRDGAKIKAVHADLDRVQEKLSQLYEHWEEAVELNG